MYFYGLSILKTLLSFSVKCLNCKAVSDTFDPFLDITLEIKVIGLHSLSLVGLMCILVLLQSIIDFSEQYQRLKLIFLSIQTAPSVSKALEQFVKPEQLDGENAYKCTK